MGTAVEKSSAPARVPALYEKFGRRYGVEPAKVGAILKATAFKTKDGPPSNEQMAALLIVADQYGLNPFTKEIFAFPDKANGIVPVVGIDGWVRIANDHDQFDGEEIEPAPRDEWEQIDSDAKLAPPYITVRIHRKDRSYPTEHTEYLDECYRPPFEGSGRNGPYKIKGHWQTHTKRALTHKARIQARRIAFGFSGIYDEDEAQRIVEGQGFDVEGEAVEIEEIGAAGWKQLVAIAEGYGYEDAERVLAANAEALGFAGPGEQMPREIAEKLRAAMDESCGGGDEDPDDDPGGAEAVEGEIADEGADDDFSAAPEPSSEAELAETFGEQPDFADREPQKAAPRKRSDSPKVTAPQLTMLGALCGQLEKLGKPEEVWRSDLLEQTGCESRTQLSKAQASHMIDRFTKAVEGLRKKRMNEEAA